MDCDVRHAGQGDMTRIAWLVAEMLTFYGTPLPAEAEAFAAALEADGPAGRRAYACLIAEAEDGSPLGFAMYSPVYEAGFLGDGVFLRDLYVVEAARGRGVGKALMAALARDCLENGMRRIDWHADRLDLDARTFYEMIAPDSFKLNRLSYRIEGGEIANLAAKGTSV